MTNLQKILSPLGYSTVALPQSGIAPLQLLSQQEADGVSPLNAEISTFFKPDIVGLPPIIANTTINIQGDTWSSIDTNAQIGFLDKILSSLGIGKLKAGFGLDISNILEFSFKDIQKDSVGLLKLDEFLTSAVLIENKFRTYGERLKRSELYVISEVLKSSNISIETRKANTINANAAMELQEVVDFNADFKTDWGNKSKMTYKLSNPIVFAFKALRIFYDKSKLWGLLGKTGFRLEEKTVVLKGVEDLALTWLPPTMVDFSPMPID